MSQMEKEGFGDEFSICPSFCFGGIRGGQNTEKLNSISVLSRSFLFWCFVRDSGVHPRHSPRTFPLGLLAPRCLGFLLILALPLCGAGARAGGCFWGGCCGGGPFARRP